MATHFQYSDRKFIQDALDINVPVSQIAQILNCVPSSIYREIKRNDHAELGYQAHYAQKVAEGRKKFASMGVRKKHTASLSYRKTPYLLHTDRRLIEWFSDSTAYRNKHRRFFQLKTYLPHYYSGFEKPIFASSFRANTTAVTYTIKLQVTSKRYRPRVHQKSFFYMNSLEVVQFYLCHIGKSTLSQKQQVFLHAKLLPLFSVKLHFYHLQKEKMEKNRKSVTLYSAFPQEKCA